MPDYRVSIRSEVVLDPIDLENIESMIKDFFAPEGAEVVAEFD